MKTKHRLRSLLSSNLQYMGTIPTLHHAASMFGIIPVPLTRYSLKIENISVAQLAPALCVKQCSIVPNHNSMSLITSTSSVHLNQNIKRFRFINRFLLFPPIFVQFFQTLLWNKRFDGLWLQRIPSRSDPINSIQLSLKCLLALSCWLCERQKHNTHEAREENLILKEFPRETFACRHANWKFFRQLQSQRNCTEVVQPYWPCQTFIA